MTTTLLIARHGETDWNRERRWQGHADQPLNALGRAQARGRAGRLRDAPPEVVYSSDLARARETAEIVGTLLGLEVRPDARLREVDVGEWSGLTTAEVETRYPDGLARRRLGRTGWERGETFEAMGIRVVAALREIAAAHRGGRVLVITHGGCMRSVWAAAGGDGSSWQASSNCDVDEIAVEGNEIRWIDSSRVGGLHQQVQG